MILPENLFRDEHVAAGGGRKTASHDGVNGKRISFGRREMRDAFFHSKRFEFVGKGRHVCYCIVARERSINQTSPSLGVTGLS